MLKSREYDSNIFDKKIELNIMSIKESDNLNREALLDKNSKELFDYVKATYIDAKEYGSIINIENKNFDIEIKNILNSENSIFKELLLKEYIPILKQSILLSNRYDIVITNPPYNARFNTILKKYLEKNFNNYVLYRIK